MKSAKLKKSISQYLKRYHSIQTVRSYRRCLVQFMDYIFEIDQTRRINGPRSTPDMKFYDDMALRYLNDARDHADDLATFIASQGEEMPAKQHTQKTVIIGWLAANDIYLHPVQTRRIRTSGKGRSRDRILKPGELRQILDHCDLQMKAYLLILSSSGMRPGELLKLHWDDVDADGSRIFLRAEITKTKTSRLTFISGEAAEVYQQWREYYPQYVAKHDAYVPWATADPRRIFPMTYGAILDKFNRALGKAGLDDRDLSTRRRRNHLHGMRKYFRTRLPMGGATIDVTEALMGHEGYLTGSYVRLTEADLESAYRQAERELWVYKTKPINEEQLMRLEAKNQELQERSDRFERQLAELTAMQADVAAYPEALQQLVDARIRAALANRGAD